MDEATGWCRGCYRSIEEIVRWGQASEADRQSLVQQLPARQASAPFPEALGNRMIQLAAQMSGDESMAMKGVL
jgi:uncharacterized protein